MTLNEIAYNLLNLMRAGRTHNDENISIAQIKFNIKHYRAMFIRRDFMRNGLITRHLEQDLGCLELEKVDASMCRDCGFIVDCPVWKTKKKIPRTVRFNFRDAITHVGDITGLGRIPLIEPYEVQWLPYDKYTANRPKAYMIEDYLYVYNPNAMELVNVRGVFEDPEELAGLKSCDPVCYDADSPFPIPADMVGQISAGLINGELKLLVTTLVDDENDRQQDKQ
jgi:hypothetical protein